jgi:hypothetical protein
MRSSCEAANSIFKLFIFPHDKQGICLLVSTYQSILSIIFYDKKPLAITISFIAFTSSVNVNNGNSWKQGNKLGSNGSSKSFTVEIPYDRHRDITC